MTIQKNRVYSKNRYYLKSGKFGYYFYDDLVMIDMTLEMILSKLNSNELKQLKQSNSIKNLTKEVLNLKNEIILLTEVSENEIK